MTGTAALSDLPKSTKSFAAHGCCRRDDSGSGWRPERSWFIWRGSGVG